MEKKNRILIIGHSYLANENRKQLDYLSEFCEICVASPNRWSGMIFNYENEIVTENRVIFHKCVRIAGLPEAAYFLKGLLSTIRKFKPDLIHVETDPFAPVFLQAYLCSLLMGGVPLVCTIRQNTYNSKGWFYDRLKYLVGKVLSIVPRHFFSVNHGVRRIYVEKFRIPVDRISVSSQIGVDTEIFHPGRDNPEHRGQNESMHFGYAGRLAEYKGILDLVEAMGELSTKHSVTLSIIGDGPERENLVSLASQNPWLDLLDPVEHSDMPHFFESIDVFVMPSKSLSWHEEHDGHAVLESMACGVPCVTSDSGVLAEWNSLIPIQFRANCKQSLVQSLDRSIQEFQHMRDATANARLFVENYHSIEAVSHSLFEVYRRVIDQ